MAQYIDKSALVAEIEKRINFNGTLNAYSRLDECYALLSFIDTLEAKEIKTEGVVKSLFENNARIYDEYGNYYYKNSENDYRFYHKIDEDNWDEDRLSLSEVTERLFSVNSIKVKEVDLEKEESVSEELGQAVDIYLKSYWGGEKEKQDWPFLKKMAIHFADWQKEQIEEALLSEVLPCFMHGGEADEVVAKLDEVLNKKK